MNNKKYILLITLSILLIFTTSLYFKKKKTFNNIISNKEKKKNINILSFNNDIYWWKFNSKNNTIQKIKSKNYLNKNKIKLLINPNNYIYKINTKLIKKNNNTEKNINFNNKINTKKDNKNLISYFKSKELEIYRIINLEKKNFEINISYLIYNLSKKKIKFNLLNQIEQYLKKNTNNDSKFSIYTQEEKFKEFNTKKENKKFNIKTKHGWISMSNQYFINVIMPIFDKNIKFINIFQEKKNNLIKLGYKTNDIYIYPKKNKKIKFKLWIGPKLINNLEKLDQNLTKNINFGILSSFCIFLFKILNYINLHIKNWGISIIIITCLIKIIFFPLSKIQYINFKKLRKIQPKIKKIKEKYKNNKKKISYKTFWLYKKNKINLFSSVIPTFIQIPIFVSMYNMLSTIVELKNSPFLFWITDLSSNDPLYILPIIMGYTIYIVQIDNKNIQNINFKNKKMVLIMSICFTIFSLNFSSAIILHYIINNLITITQQKLFNKNE